MAGKISRTSNHPPTVGEVVLMDDDSQLLRGQWPMAVILDLVISRDSEKGTANYVDTFNYPDLGHVLEVVLNNWKTAVVTLLAVMALSVAAICLLRSIIFRLLC
ncbi:unnamed protein product [Nippostrongylus brasiliensis]|uniref:DUF5641 domain-containing protein n=1 Tax=Nippostrongylus brasiliensis TaxID=27835 RepID=A0A0N4YND1_NIPBR|nr:hypothetical protein Q1695_000853 [Nippostrongylus brasiliensis]VDL82465.1 unnamed protein product [Nippostrongylus brasiliensis]